MAKPRKKRNPDAPPASWSIPEPMPLPDDDGADPVRHLMDLYRNLYRTDAGDKASEAGWSKYVQSAAAQYKSYLAELVRRSPDLMSHEALSALDMIDASALEDEPWPAGLMLDYLPYALSLEHPVYAFLPCFPKGVFLLPSVKGTIPNYAQYEVLDLDAKRETFTLLLRDYCIAADRFEPGIGCAARIDASSLKLPFRPDALPAPDIRIDREKNVTFMDLYTRVPPRDMGWDRAQARRWRRAILQNAVDHYAQFEAAGVDIFEQLVRRFLSGTLAVNASLSSKKPVILKDADPDRLLGAPDRKPDRPAGDPDMHPDGSGQDAGPKPSVPAPERRVRSVGLVKFASAQAPRPASKTARNYKLASWTARGHIRHYKSGKQVYIQATVKHRRKAAVEHDPAPSTIKLRDNRPDKA